MVSFSKVHVALAAMNGDNETGLITRLQYLNHQGFPPGLRVGRNKRTDYELDEVLAFTLWFSLTQASFSPATAMALVSDFWPEFTRLLLAVAQTEGHPGVRVPDASETIAVISGNALKSTSKGGRDNPLGPARPWNIAASSPGRLASNLSDGLGASVVIDLTATWRALRGAMTSEPAPVTENWLNDQIHSIASREGRTSRPEERQSPSPKVRRKEVPPRGEKLGERDYYFARAIELIESIRGSEAGALLSPRLTRLALYMLTPSPREDWKRWVEVGNSGTQFVLSIAELIERRSSFRTHIPETLRLAVSSRFGDANLDTLADQLQATAERARDYELVTGDPAGEEVSST